LRDAADSAGDAHETQQTALRNLVMDISMVRPFLHSSLNALGVLTPITVAQVLADLREKQTKYDAQTGQVDAAKRSMHEGSARLQEIDTRIAEQQNRITIGKELEAVRAAFIPTGITTEYIAHQFQRIAVVAQDHLAQMSADFMVVASEERALSFDYLRLNEAGGAWLDQDSMSGGQQVKLAIAIILAIHELIIPQVGLLVLDEPSTHLDTDSRIELANVLKEIGRRGNFQLIICDHSPELKDAYTDTIELSAIQE
jgi:DNA repair exonuclease SbcCD ATPase subunit